MTSPFVNSPAVPASTAKSATPKAIKLPLTFSKVPGSGDIKVLNYALSLEQLEADLYAQALLRLTTGGTNALGTTIPGLGYTSADADVALITEFGIVEQQHRDFLTSALGSKAIPTFKYDFGIDTKTRQEVLDLVLQAEATGVSAYLGAASLISSATYLAIAGAIQGTEARHTAVLSELVNELFDEGVTVAPLSFDNGGRDTPLTPAQVLAMVAPFFVAA
jgi:hypothetical protein